MERGKETHTQTPLSVCCNSSVPSLCVQVDAQCQRYRSVVICQSSQTILSNKQTHPLIQNCGMSISSHHVTLALGLKLPHGDPSFLQGNCCEEF